MCIRDSHNTCTEHTFSLQNTASDLFYSLHLYVTLTFRSLLYILKIRCHRSSSFLPSLARMLMIKLPKDMRVINLIFLNLISFRIFLSHFTFIALYKEYYQRNVLVFLLERNSCIYFLYL